MKPFIEGEKSYIFRPDRMVLQSSDRGKFDKFSLGRFSSSILPILFLTSMLTQKPIDWAIRLTSRLIPSPITTDTHLFPGSFQEPGHSGASKNVRPSSVPAIHNLISLRDIYPVKKNVIFPENIF